MVKVKICGLTRILDAKIAEEAGADMIGVIVNAKVKTPRNLDYRRARKILEQVSSGIEKVVVGMPRNLSEGLEIIEELNPDLLQIHSYPSLSEVGKLKKVTGKKLITTMLVPPKVSDPTKLIAQAEEIAKVSNFILLDIEKKRGRTLNWAVSRKIRDALKIPTFLAGGLNPSNIHEAIKKVQPYGVDVASGVESDPGIKDPEKVKAFVEASKERW